MRRLEFIDAILVGPEVIFQVPKDLLNMFIEEFGGKLMEDPPPKFFGCTDGFLVLFGIQLSKELSCVYSLKIRSDDLSKYEEMSTLYEYWSSYGWVATTEEIENILEKHIKKNLN